MPTPGEHKTVQARILAYAGAIGWTIVSREEAEQRRAIAAMLKDEFRMTNLMRAHLGEWEKLEKRLNRHTQNNHKIT